MIMQGNIHLLIRIVNIYIHKVLVGLVDTASGNPKNKKGN